MLTYRDLAQDVSHATSQDAVFLCGYRCAAEVNLGQNRIGRMATAPVDVLTDLVLEIRDEITTGVTAYPSHVEKQHQLGPGISATSVWFASSDRPGFAVWFAIDNRSSGSYRFELGCVARYNVNFISKFRVYPNDTARLDGDHLVVEDRRYTALHAVTATNPAWEHCAIDPVAAGGDSVRAAWTTALDVAPGTSASVTLAIAGCSHVGVAAETVRSMVADPAAAFDETVATWEQRIAAGVTIETPRPELDRLYMQSKLWGYKDARIVPLGAPFDGQRNDNAELVALTASPDYHGIFANDNAQSCWEFGALGPAFYPVLDNTLEVLYRFGTPESVEIDPFDATGSPWCSPLRIGERPQWVMGACYLILWSGQYIEQYWPRIREVLARFTHDDADGDWLDDYSSSTFPEQPDPGAYRHEMLYASAFWFQAFELASSVATLAGDAVHAEEYRAAARHVARAVETAFGTEYGYASWLDQAHAQHPHRGHNMVLPLQYGMASAERAERTFQTLLSEPLWSEDGPLAIEPAYPLAGGAHAWAFTRWNLVHALYRYGATEKATALVCQWADQEAGLFYQAPEGFPTITGVTGKGYSWTAGRTQRAILCGLFGLDFHHDGFTIAPRLPANWPSMRLRNVPFRGATYDVQIERGDRDEVMLDGIVLATQRIPAPDESGHHHVVVRTSAQPQDRDEGTIPLSIR